MLNMMLKQMRSATENSALSGSQQQEMMTSMLDQQLSQQLASVGDGIGLSKILIQQLSSSSAPGTNTDSSTAMSPVQQWRASRSLNRGPVAGCRRWV